MKHTKPKTRKDSPSFNFAFIVYPKHERILTTAHYAECIYHALSALTPYAIRSVSVSPLHTPAGLKPHRHVLIKLNKRARPTSVDNLRNKLSETEVNFWKFKKPVRLQNLIGFSAVERVSSFESYYAYLTHENEPEKQQFSALEQTRSFPFAYNEKYSTMLTEFNCCETKGEKEMRGLKKISELIKESRPRNLTEFIDWIDDNKSLSESQKLDARLLCKRNYQWIKNEIFDRNCCIAAPAPREKEVEELSEFELALKIDKLYAQLQLLQKQKKQG